MSTKKKGRPTAYKAEYKDQARRLCLLGATDSDLADFFAVTEQTINNWKTKHPDFFESLRQGKIVADSHVAESLYARAVGYEHPEEKVMHHQGKVVRAQTTKRYPPDTQAAALWLKNRRPDDWRDDRHIHVDTTGTQQVIMMLPPDLAQVLAARRGEKLEDMDIIETTYKVIENEAGE